VGLLPEHTAVALENQPAAHTTATIQEKPMQQLSPYPLQSALRARAIHCLLGVVLCAGLSLPQGAKAWSLRELLTDCKQEVKGQGRVSDEARSVGDFSALQVRGSMHVVARQGSAPSVNVQAQPELLPAIETVVENGTLLVRTKPGMCWSSPEKVTVLVTFAGGGLHKISLEGSGDLAVSGLRQKHLSVSLAGSGDLKLGESEVDHLKASLAGSGDLALQGSGQTLDISLAGSGDIHALQWLAQHGKVSVAGSGDVELSSSASLEASIAGSGDVRYRGPNAQVKRSVAGSGSVRALAP
jgi:hypothetical protein